MAFDSQGNTFIKATCCIFQSVECVVKHSNGSEDKITLLHTMNDGQLEWFKAGSALNRMAEKK